MMTNKDLRGFVWFFLVIMIVIVLTIWVLP
jgi:hypothetical protein